VQQHLNGLSRADRERFDERGLVKLPGLVDRKAAEAMAESLWREMARKDGVQRREPRTWRVERPAHFRALQDSDAFKAMGGPAVRAVLDDLMGRDRWEVPQHWGLPLVCFPRPHGRWDVPTQNWHLDLPANPANRHKQVGRVFLLLAPLKARGGGTLVALGSHRIAERIVGRTGERYSSAEMRKRLKDHHRWFYDLMTPDKSRRDRTAWFMEAETEVDGVSLQVEEMTGEPGDVLLMHPSALHAGAPNMLSEPRLALTQFVMPIGWNGP
jgi:ectoine hydroxylase-related dioxygenase (phytanoyl-CoA dioxygenase family)